ncbi:hypothetical protein A2U01_0110155, partial [Trifolium medium]|nr:hypothetical protein [Trifolium medium]
ENLEEENQMLREQVSSMQTEMQKLTAMVTSMMVTQNRVLAPAP